MSEKKKKKKVPLYLKIILGMVLGIAWGILATKVSWGPSFTKDYIKPFGAIFINLLKLIAVPIILSSLITGVASLKDLSKLGRIGGKTILIFLFTATIATSLGISIALLLEPGKKVSLETRNKLIQKFSPFAEKAVENAKEFKEAGPLKILQDMVPDNAIHAASDNKLMIQVVIFAILMGVAVVKASEKSEAFLKFFESLNDVLIKLVGLIMVVAPLGVFALIGSVLPEVGEGIFEFLYALLSYCITVLIALVVMLFIVYPLIIRLFSNTGYREFFKGMQPALLLGFSTSSSNAALPVTMERVEKHLKVPEYISRFVLPFGTTINMDGTAIYQSVAAVFTAQALGLDLSLMQMATIVITATMAAAGAAGIPGAGMVTLVIVLESVGIPSFVGIALITPPDRILDMCRTVVNVAGDGVAAVVIAGTEKNKAIN
jgi:Na+/H+-dicarboxylate symporter